MEKGRAAVITHEPIEIKLHPLDKEIQALLEKYYPATSVIKNSIDTSSIKNMDDIDISK